MIGIIFGFLFISLALVTLLKSAGIIAFDINFGLVFLALIFLFIGLKLVIKPKKSKYRFWSWKGSPCACGDREDNDDRVKSDQKF